MAADLISLAEITPSPSASNACISGCTAPAMPAPSPIAGPASSGPLSSSASSLRSPGSFASPRSLASPGSRRCAGPDDTSTTPNTTTHTQRLLSRMAILPDRPDFEVHGNAHRTAQVYSRLGQAEHSTGGRRPAGMRPESLHRVYSVETSPTPEMPVGEIQILLPIVLRHVVLTPPDVVADRAGNRRVQGRHLVGRQPVGPQQPIDRIGMEADRNSPRGSAHRSFSALAT